MRPGELGQETVRSLAHVPGSVRIAIVLFSALTGRTLLKCSPDQLAGAKSACLNIEHLINGCIYIISDPGIAFRNFLHRPSVDTVTKPSVRIGRFVLTQSSFRQPTYRDLPPLQQKGQKMGKQKPMNCPNIPRNKGSGTL